MKKIILRFIVLCVSLMAFGMVALAADPKAPFPVNGNVPKGHECDNKEYGHFIVEKVIKDGYVVEGDEGEVIEDGVTGWEYSGDGISYRGEGNTIHIDLFYGTPEYGDIYYWLWGYKLCSGAGSEKDDDDDDEKSEGSSSDDKPAGPTENQLKQDSIYSSVDSQIKSIVESVGNGDSQNNGRVTIDGEELVNSLPKRVMSKMAENPSIELFFNYTCNGMKYTTVIPAGASIDPTIEWFGPVYLMTHYPTLWHQTNETSVPVMAPVN